MKKLLALVLAMVMTLGLATVSSSAAYSDAADVSLNEAVDVMSAVGVFQGADGKFSPKANLNREQAAKLIAYLDLGESAAEALPAVKVFSDVPATSWSAKYIAYCADAGYIVGDGTGKFNPTGELTGYAFGKMVLCVLGYDADIEGFTGNNWSINVAKLMEKNDIADGIDGAASATLTREQAAQYCLNALQATMVEYDTKGTSIEINGAKIATGASAAKAVATTAATETGAIADTNGVAGTLQLGEKLYKGDLKLTDDVDDLGRPADKWTYKNDDVIVKGAKADLTFTVSSTSGTKATLAGQLLAQNSKYKVGNGTGVKALTANTDLDDAAAASATNAAVSALYVNGGSETPATLTYVPAKGDVIEVFLNADDAKLIETVVVTRYKLTKINKVDTNVSSADAKDDVTAYVTFKAANTYVLNDSDINGYNAATYVKGAYVAVAYKWTAAGLEDGTQAVDSYIVTPAAEGKVTAFKATDYYTIGGTKYTTTATVYESEYQAPDYTGTYALYTTKEGYAIGIVEIESGKSGSDAVYVNYVWHVEKADDYNHKLSTTYAQVVDMEGKVSNIVIGKTTSKGEVFGLIWDGTSAYKTYAKAASGSKLVQKDTGLLGATSANDYSTIKYDNGSAWTNLTGYLAILTEHSSDGYTSMAKYVNGTDSTYDVYDTSAGKGTGTAIKASDTKVAGVYVNSSTRYLVVDGNSDTVKVTVKDGGLSWTHATGVNATILYKKSGSAEVASYVIIPAEYVAGAAKDVVYVKSVNSNTATNEHGKIYTVFFEDGTQKDITVPSGESVGEGVYAKYSIGDNDVYDLTAVTESQLTADVADWDGKVQLQTGAFYNVKFGSMYEGKLSVTNVLGNGSGPYSIDDIDADKAIVIDRHETDDVEYADDEVALYNGDLTVSTTLNIADNRHTYSGKITDLDTLNDLPSGYVAVCDIYVTEDGVQTVIVEDVYQKVDTTLAARNLSNLTFSDAAVVGTTWAPFSAATITISSTGANTGTVVIAGTKAAGGSAFATGDTITLALAANAAGAGASVSASSVTLTHNGTSWNTQTVTVTHSGLTRTYTVSIGTIS